MSYDTPEGGFDALAQAITCKDQIGWSSKSRRLIVFATDANSHLAGNGKVTYYYFVRFLLVLNLYISVRL